jgi:uncharacterized protein involved in exopolysaccharide biosynthesis
MIEETRSTVAAQFSTPPQSRATLLDVAVAIVKHKALVLGIPLLVGAITAAGLSALPNVYTATARIMPPQQKESSASAMLGALSGITGGFGGAVGSAFGLKNPNDLFVGMLKSHTIADHLIVRFNLKEVYGEKTQSDTRRELERVTDIIAGKDGLIVVEVDDTDPQRAADMANAYVEELDRLTQRLAISEAGQRRLFFQRELKTVRERLASAEVAMRGTQEHTGLIQPDGQARAIFQLYADMRARVAAKEVEVAMLRTFATDQNPDLTRAVEELANLRAQAAKLEKSSPRRADGDILVPTGKVAEAGLEFGRRMRDVKYYETLFELLAKQFEMAKIDEAKDAVMIQAVDIASPPDVNVKPRRGLITAAATLLSAFVATVLAVALEANQRMRADSAYGEKLTVLRRHLRLR